MMRHIRLEHIFLEHLPDRLEPGVLYIAMEFGTVSHLCCCGCGAEVVTPLTPTDWKLIYDGETISLTPSVGSWSLPCRSHYFIDRSRVRECGRWTKEQVDQEQIRDKVAKAEHFGVQSKPKALESSMSVSKPLRLRDRISGWFFGNRS